ncbi:glycoside hydrolase family 78 protein [[Eubacterium] cellulosolvens]
MRLSRGWSALLVILILSLAITSNQIADASCSINRGITWFLNSDSKVYSPSTGSWQDIDLSGDSDIPVGATGVVLEIINEDAPGNPHIGQVRAKDSTDDRTSGAKIEGTTQIMAFVKLDVNKIFQAYRDNNNIKFYVRGYTGEFVFFYSDWSNVKGAASTGSQVTVNLGGAPFNVPSNAIAILELYDQVDTGHAQLYFKRTGTTSLTIRYGQGGTANAHQFIMIGCNSFSRFDYWRTSGSVNDYNQYNLVGYILPIGTPGVGFWLTNPVGNIQGSIPTDTWSDIDITSTTSSSATTALTLIQCKDLDPTAPGDIRKADIRKNGSSDDKYDFSEHYDGPDTDNLPETSIFYTVGLDNSQIFEARVESSYNSITLLGYTIDISAPNPPDNPLCEGQTNPTNIITFTPTFSWTFSDPDPGDTQDAYQLQVSIGVDGSGTILWDTGKTSTSSSSVAYSGATLSRGVTYHWRVKTWDTLDLDGAYTSDQTFMINQLPIASDLKTEGLTDPQDLKTFSPTFSWIYQDPDMDSQNQYEIEVGTSLDGNDMWNPSIVSGSSTSIQYSGIPLSICTVYHVRVRVYDGFEWSNDWTRGTFQLKGATVDTSTSSGIAQFDTDIGCLTQLNAVNEETLPEVGKPELDYIHGFFSIEITNLNPGDTVNVFIRLPTSMLRDTEYWGHNPSSSTWYPIPLSYNDGDNFIIIQLVDGGLGDDDPTDGVIYMTGGPGQPRLPPVAGVLTPVDKVSLITPYLSAALLIAALITSLSFGNRMIKKSKEFRAH